jgi:hypothetical protein
MDHRRILAQHHPATIFGTHVRFTAQGRPLGA